MNKFKLWHLAVISFAVFLIFGTIAASAVALNSSLLNTDEWEIDDINIGWMFLPGKEYAIDSEETAAIDNSTKISVDAVSADINISEYSGDSVYARLYGQYKSRKGELELNVTTSGSTIIIEVDYPNSGVTSTDLILDIKIPENYSGDLQINNVSSEVDLECESIDFKALSIDTVSGETTLNTISTESLDIDTVSGSISASVVSGSVDVDGISADVSLSGLTDSVKINTISGQTKLWIEEYGDIDVDSTSGDTVITLETNDDFYVEFDTVSGDFDCDIPLTIKSQQDNDFKGYSGSENSVEFKVDTVSGDLTIKQ